MKVGVLSLQGAFDAHAQTLRKLGVEPVFVRKPEHMDRISGLILPGGESTAHLLLIEKSGLRPHIEEFGRRELPLFGTCAGLILMAEQVSPSQARFGLLPVSVERNAYGSQKESFTEEIPIPCLGGTFPCVFIRAPVIARAADDVEVLASFRDRPVLVRHRRSMGATFHPELAEDARIHRLFLELCKERHFYGL